MTKWTILSLLICYFTFKKCSVDGDRHLEHIICPTPSWFATHLHFWHGDGLAVSVIRLTHTSVNFLTISLCITFTSGKRWCKLKRVPFVSNAKGVHRSFGSVTYNAGYIHIICWHHWYLTWSLHILYVALPVLEVDGLARGSLHYVHWMPRGGPHHTPCWPCPVQSVLWGQVVEAYAVWYHFLAACRSYCRTLPLSLGMMYTVVEL